ncbi:CPBP family intramembrane metalloprotease [Lederbergia sp. NSJ-179]|uniref:CPBP family intramembrane glutamic endopeptidase n=1 Tax=Lederbergia sp. NSJ-179 TaxID=2931402 RepID=UPI001FD1AF22|nr:CPBP family intramembrane glutamic endopeptidase [Lederbergia sp. NSJ-179]MCJ7841473.1 CPBP family intramembrane metalloprotease [Lederbergia sp. NSJ-179]
MKNAWLVSFIRIPLLFVMLIILFLLFKWFGLETTFPFFPDLSTIYFTVVNVFCFFLLHRMLKNEGRSFKELIDFRSERLGKDILSGFLWLFVLYFPFILAVMCTMFIMYGSDFIHNFQTVFAGEVESTFSRPRWLMWFAACISLIFPFLNAPIEELMYRGYAQPLFIRHYKKVWIGIFIPSIGFAFQHVMLAASIQGAIVYAVAFLVWGIGSGFIYHKQKRLFPLIVCHFIVNIAFSAMPIIFLIFGVY